jgi:hypothetical protein
MQCPRALEPKANRNHATRPESPMRVVFQIRRRSGAVLRNSEPPPIWLDEHGQRRPTRQRPKCGREDPVLRLRPGARPTG